MALLRSYVAGDWHTAPDEGTPLHDATTGEEVARISSTGIDMAGALAYGRTVGGPALRALTFHQRAALLKALASYLREHREELYALSARTGATLGDSKFDIDGGIGVLFTYSSKGRRELPNDTVYVDGAVEPLSKGGTFVGQHIATPLRGVAIQINAFNFPVWGPLEKFAPAFLAGVPSLIKPASQTAYLTARLVELILASKLLPEGSLQFIAGSVGDLLDHVTEQDLVSFTGSASTANKLRAHPAVVRNSVRFNAEADSLNCSILGPDAKPGSTEFDLYVKQLVNEMTVKAGQKCTAIRRAFVPAEQIDAVAAAASARLAKVTVGDPTGEARMGALASLEQREEVRRSLKSLMSVATVVYGDPRARRRASARMPSAARSSHRCCCAATTSTAPNRTRSRRSARSAPCCPTRRPSRSSSSPHAARAAWPGRSSPADADFARAVVLGIAPWHGRLLVLDATDAKESTGHGSPLPALVHGGPGRAGGGEEMGGIRGVLHHMQRTAVQASPARAQQGHRSLGGRRASGARAGTRSASPWPNCGSATRWSPGHASVTQADIDHFAEFTGDTFYAHTDEAAAKANPLFGGIVAHGYLVVSFAAGLFVPPEPGPVLANYGLENLRFLTPVYPGDELTVTLTAKQITPRENADYGEVRWDAEVTKQDGSSAAKYDVLTLVAKS